MARQRIGERRINSLQFQDTISAMLEQFGDDVVTEVVQDSINEVTTQAVKKLKKAGKFNGGEKYRAGWSKEIRKGRINTLGIIYNKNKPGLAHLLEFGHIASNGKRTKPYEHIAPVNEEMELMFVKAFDSYMADHL